MRFFLLLWRFGSNINLALLMCFLYQKNSLPDLLFFYWFVYFLHVLRTPNVWTGYPPAVRPVYPYSGDSTGPGSGQPNSAQPPSSAAQDPYNRYNTNPAAGYSPRPPYGTPQGAVVPPASQASGPGPYPGHPDYYNRPDQVIIVVFIRKLA